MFGPAEQLFASQQLLHGVNLYLKIVLNKAEMSYLYIATE